MLEGAVLNQRYRLLQRLGEGGMAVVYRAEDLLLGRTVAVKALREDLARDEVFLARFQTEARAAANLSHPNIAAIFDVGFDLGRHYIVMEFVDGPTLRDLIHQGAPFPVGRAVDLATQVLSALEHAHGRGVVHRDIKPQNILITNDGRVKVVDFGIARLLAAASATQTGEVFGTAFYLAPERAKGEESRPASDVYAVGVVLYEMLTGRVPFSGDSPIEVALKHLQEAPAPPRALNPAVPPRLEAVILQAMAKEPEQRFASAGAMRQALREYAHSAADTTAALGVGRRPVAPPPVAPAAGAAPAAAAAAPGHRGVPWTTVSLLLVTVALLAVLVPVGALFYNAFLRPFFDGTGGLGPVATPTPARTATVAVTPTVTATPTASPTPTATATPTASPTPRYPAWMRFIEADRQWQLIKDNKQRLGEVRGEILDRAGNRVPGLKVRIESADGQWSAERPRPNIDHADGTFRFDQLNRGRYRLTVLDADNKPISQTVEGLATDEVDRDFKGYIVWYVTFREPAD